MQSKNLNNLVKSLFIGLLLMNFSSCGDDKKEEKSDLIPPTTVTITLNEKVQLNNGKDGIEIEILWSASADENENDFAGYNVYKSQSLIPTDSVGNFLTPLKLNSTLIPKGTFTFYDTVGTSNTDFYYQVRSVNNDDEFGTGSPNESFRYDLKSPETVNVKPLFSNGNSIFEISWNESEDKNFNDFTSYEILRLETDNIVSVTFEEFLTNGISLATVNSDTIFTDNSTSLEFGKFYYYSIVAKNSANTLSANGNFDFGNLVNPANSLLIVDGPYEIDENSLSLITELKTLDSAYVVVKLSDENGLPINNQTVNFTANFGSFQVPNLTTSDFVWAGLQLEGSARVKFYASLDTGNVTLSASANLGSSFLVETLNLSVVPENLQISASGLFELNENSINPINYTFLGDTSYFVVELKDENNLPVNNKEITFSSTWGQIIPDNNFTSDFTWSGQQFSGAVRGKFISDANTGSGGFTAHYSQFTVNEVSTYLTTEIYTNVPDSIQVSISGKPQLKNSGGTESVTVSAQLLDAFWVPTKGEIPLAFTFEQIPNPSSSQNDQPFLSDGTNNHYFGEQPLQVLTNDSGFAEITLNSGTQIGEVEIKVCWEGDCANVSKKVKTEILAGPPESIFINYSGSDVEPLTNGLYRAEISATVQDIFGNYVEDSTMVNFTIQGIDSEKVIRKVPGSSGNPPIQCEIVDEPSIIQDAELSILGEVPTGNEGEVTGIEADGRAFSEIIYSATSLNSKAWIFAKATNSNGAEIVDSVLVTLNSNDKQIWATVDRQNAKFGEVDACFTVINVTANLRDGNFQNAIEGTPIKFSSTAGRFTKYVDFDGIQSNCLYEIDQTTGSLDPNSCFGLNWQTLNPNKTLPNFPSDFSQPHEAVSFTNEFGVASNLLVISCDDVDDPQQPSPPFPIVSTENISITVTVVGTNINDSPPPITLTKQHYNPGEDPGTPADLKCRVGTCVNGASAWGSPFCYKSIIDPIDLTLRDLKRTILDYRSKEVFEIPDLSCTNWYDLSCGTITFENQ